ncbi:NADH-quinone oxidoreductase subunit L, partial [Herbaspirillum frisingense]
VGLGLGGAAGLTLAALVAHLLPLQIVDFPRTGYGVLALLTMLALYVCMGLLQLRPQAMAAWRRRSYAGFYLDEAYTRLALTLWPSDWAPKARRAAANQGTTQTAPSLLGDARH